MEIKRRVCAKSQNSIFLASYLDQRLLEAHSFSILFYPYTSKPFIRQEIERQRERQRERERERERDRENGSEREKERKGVGER